jgi:hypothetical protein
MKREQCLKLYSMADEVLIGGKHPIIYRFQHVSTIQIIQGGQGFAAIHSMS